MLFTNPCSIIANFTQGMQEMLPIIIERKTTVGKPKHSRTMRILPGEQAGTAGRAGWSGAKRLTEQYPLLGEALNIWSSNRMTIGLNIAPGIMRVNIEDIWTISVHRKRLLV